MHSVFCTPIYIVVTLEYFLVFLQEIHCCAFCTLYNFSLATRLRTFSSRTWNDIREAPCLRYSVCLANICTLCCVWHLEAGCDNSQLPPCALGRLRFVGSQLHEHCQWLQGRSPVV